MCLTAIALLALGIGAILRHTAAAISVVAGLVFIPAIMLGVLPERIGESVERICPTTAGLAIQRTTGDGPIDPWLGARGAVRLHGGRAARRAVADRAARRMSRATRGPVRG